MRAATLDSLRAIMMIRAYRMRGHLKANLDPLGIATTPGDASELDPATYGFGEADLDVLGVGVFDGVRYAFLRATIDRQVDRIAVAVAQPIARK